MQNDSTLKRQLLFRQKTMVRKLRTAFRNKNAELPHPDSLTYLRKGYDNIYFSFPNLEERKSGA